MPATLSTIADQQLGTPSTIVIGEVAAADLAWFQNRPLFGRRVVVAHAAHEQAGELVDATAGPGRGHGRGAGHRDPRPRRRRGRAGGGGGPPRRLRLGGPDLAQWCSPAARCRAGSGPRRPRLRRGPAGRDRTGHGRGVGRRQPRGRPGARPAVRGGVAARCVCRHPAPPEERLLLVRAAVAGADVLPEGLRGQGWDVDVVEAYRARAGAAGRGAGGRGGRRRRRDVHVIVDRQQLPGGDGGPAHPSGRWPPSGRSRPPPPSGNTGWRSTWRPRSTRSTGWSTHSSPGPSRLHDRAPGDDTGE